MLISRECLHVDLELRQKAGDARHLIPFHGHAVQNHIPGQVTAQPLRNRRQQRGLAGTGSAQDGDEVAGLHMPAGWKSNRMEAKPQISLIPTTLHPPDLKVLPS